MKALLPACGLYSGTLSGIPAGGWYSLEVRAVTGGIPGDPATLDKIGVGDIFITAGQSNAASYGNPAATVDADRICALTNITGSSPTWVLASDPMPVAAGTLGGTRGSPWTRLGPMLTDLYDVPVANATFTTTDLDTLQGGGAGSATGKSTDVSVTFTTGSAIATNQALGIRITKLTGSATYLDFETVEITKPGAWAGGGEPRAFVRLAVIDP